MVAMQCVFCIFWQDSDINDSDAVRFCVFWQDSDINGSDAVHVFYIRTAISIVSMQCVFCVFWQDNDINGSDAVRVLCILAGQRYQW